MGWNLAGAKDFLFHKASYLAPRIYPPSCVVGTKGPYPAPANAEVLNEWKYPSILPYAFVVYTGTVFHQVQGSRLFLSNGHKRV